MSKTTVVKPRLSEKTHALSNQGVYVVMVAPGVNKHSVARAIETQFDVKVAKVNILNVKGKAKRTMSLSGKRTRATQGKRSDLRKAYITLANDQKLPFFEAIEEEAAKEHETQEKMEKALEKQAKKEAAPRRRFSRKKAEEA